MLGLITQNYMGDPMTMNYQPRGPWFWIIIAVLFIFLTYMVFM